MELEMHPWNLRTKKRTESVLLRDLAGYAILTARRARSAGVGAGLQTRLRQTEKVETTKPEAAQIHEV